ncbi:MAG: 50S ribosomal protein L15 [Maricaulaceae bacterium]
MRLNELSDNPGATKARTRVGRGVGSGKGKTGGRGVKGQKSRSGVAIKGFEGGQMPLHMRLPKRGFNKPNRARYVELSLGRLQAALDAGKLDAGQASDEAALAAAGVVRRVRDGVRVIGGGALTSKITLTVTGASTGAKAAIEAVGGSVTLTSAAAETTSESASD